MFPSVLILSVFLLSILIILVRILSVLILYILRLSNDDVYNFLEATVEIHLCILFITYSMIALRTVMKSDTLTNEDSNTFHEEDSGDEMDTANDFCRICRGSSEAASKLIHPCNCYGSMMYVHFNCLKNWFRISTSIKNVIYMLLDANERTRQSLSCASCRSQYKGLILRKKQTPLFFYIWNNPWNLYSLFYGPTNPVPTRITMPYLCVFLKIYITWTTKPSDDLIQMFLRIGRGIFFPFPFYTFFLLCFLELGVEFVDLEMSYILLGHEIFITRDFIERERLTERTETETTNEEDNINRQ